MGANNSTKDEREEVIPVRHGAANQRRASHFESTEIGGARFSRKLSKLIEKDIEEEDEDDIAPTSTTTQPKGASNGLVHGGEAFELNLDEDFESMDFPYENIVFEGGGSQGNAYIGAIAELERLGFLPKIKRFAGASVGSITAAFVAVGHGSERLMRILDEGPQFGDLLDAPCGTCSLIPNFMRHLGWHPGKKAYEWLGSMVDEKLGDSQATFKDLYDRTGRELCVVVTNLSLMMEEYCHVKTTPNMPIITAVRMSMSAPGVFFPYKRHYMGRTDVYIDGGVICNYPVHCFDGWWLSMKPEDSFLKRMQPLDAVAKLLTKKERFGYINEKTFGMIIFSDYDSHVLATNSELIASPAPIPDTKLARAHIKVKSKRDLTSKQHTLLTNAMTRFLKVLDDNNLDGNNTIDIDEFKQAFKDSEFTHTDAVTIFGDGLSVDDIFDKIDTNKDGQIDFNELMALAEQEGVGLQTHQIGAGRLDIASPADFIGGLFQSLLMNVKRAFLEGGDIDRTVLIDTVYLKSLDFNAGKEDLAFIVEQGRRGVRAFLKYQYQKSETRSLSVDSGKAETDDSFRDGTKVVKRNRSGLN